MIKTWTRVRADSREKHFRIRVMLYRWKNPDLQFLWICSWRFKLESNHVSNFLATVTGATSMLLTLMRRSNWKFNIPPPLSWANPGHLTIFCARGVGSLICKAFPGVEIWFLPGCGGEIEPGVSGFNYFFSGAKVATSHKQVFGQEEI